MPDKRTFRLNRCYGIFFLVLTLLLGCLFILQTADIYFSAIEARDIARAEAEAQAQAEGWSPVITQIKVAVAVKSIPIYSRQIAAERLGKLLPYVCIWLAALIGAIVVALVNPKSKQVRHSADTMLGEKLKAARKNLPTEPKSDAQALADALAAHEQVRKQSRYLMIAVAALCVLGLVPPLLYFTDIRHFPAEAVNSEVAAAALYALPFLLVVLAGSIAYVYVQHRLLKKENDTIKAALAAGVRPRKAVPPKKLPLILICRIVLLVVGLGLFILGTQNGSMQEVLIKATKICTECIGLG